MKRGFLRDHAGNVTLYVAILAIPLFMVAGIAIDYARASLVKSFLQAEADAAALAAAKGGASANDAVWVTNLRNNAQERFSTEVVNSLTANGNWVTPTDFSVTASAAVPVTLMAI
ncbi:MAG TPA: pilus assembly protein TadG-related protein, partial [Nordella sp.]|nr:pilus assembly protein TadG-related protein [Nordella sp.]